MHYTAWEQRQGDTVALVDDTGKKIGVFPQRISDQSLAEVEGQEWLFTVAGDESIKVQGPSFPMSVTPGDSGWKRSKRLEVQLGETSVVAQNESKNNWVYVRAADDVKLAQFSGANSGVRQALTEFEPDVELSVEQIAFLSLVSRLTLEGRLRSSAMIWIIVMILLSVAVVFTVIF